MNEVIKKIKEAHIQGMEKCDNNCSKCPLDKIIFETYGEGLVTICDCLERVFRMNFNKF